MYGVGWSGVGSWYSVVFLPLRVKVEYARSTGGGKGVLPSIPSIETYGTPGGGAIYFASSLGHRLAGTDTHAYKNAQILRNKAPLFRTMRRFQGPGNLRHVIVHQLLTFPSPLSPPDGTRRRRDNAPQGCTRSDTLHHQNLYFRGGLFPY